MNIGVLLLTTFLDFFDDLLEFLIPFFQRKPPKLIEGLYFVLKFTNLLITKPKLFFKHADLSVKAYIVRLYREKTLLELRYFRAECVNKLLNVRVGLLKFRFKLSRNW